MQLLLPQLVPHRENTSAANRERVFHSAITRLGAALTQSLGGSITSSRHRERTHPTAPDNASRLKTSASLAAATHVSTRSSRSPSAGPDTPFIRTRRAALVTGPSSPRRRTSSVPSNIHHHADSGRTPRRGAKIKKQRTGSRRYDVINRATLPDAIDDAIVTPERHAPFFRTSCTPTTMISSRL